MKLLYHSHSACALLARHGLYGAGEMGHCPGSFPFYIGIGRGRAFYATPGQVWLDGHVRLSRNTHSWIDPALDRPRDSGYDSPAGEEEWP